MKRERALQIVLVLVGLFYTFWGYILFDALWRSRWLSRNDDVGPMFVSLNFVLGVFLLLAVKHPARHRSLIAYGAWSSCRPCGHDDDPIGRGLGARDSQER